MLLTSVSCVEILNSSFLPFKSLHPHHRFTKEVLERTFKSNDLAVSARNLLKDRENPVDLIQEVDLNYLPDVNTKDKITVICQSGMRYTQAEALVRSLMMDEKFNNISAVERKRITDRILSEVKGRMMEEIVLLETKLSNPNKEVFQLKFAVGEFDMVVCDPENLNAKYMKSSTAPRFHRNNIDTWKMQKNAIKQNSDTELLFQRT